MTTGQLRSQSAQGETTLEMVAGQSYFREAGVEHDVSNPNVYEFVFIETELKRGAWA
jgi:mannose-6-phosphate isomerase-like protein (cupin superfamily)